jgi:hypothetical protein
MRPVLNGHVMSVIVPCPEADQRRILWECTTCEDGEDFSEEGDPEEIMEIIKVFLMVHTLDGISATNN